MTGQVCSSLTRIVVTHAHRDHSALAPRLAARSGAEVLAFGRARDGMSPRMAALAAGLTASAEGLDLAFAPDRRLADGDRISGPDWQLRVLHTPGHLGTHLCLALGDVLFTGDHVMGWATSIVSPPEGDMGDYMASLDKLRAVAVDMLSDLPSSCRKLAALLDLDRMTVWRWRRLIAGLWTDLPDLPKAGDAGATTTVFGRFGAAAAGVDADRARPRRGRRFPR